MSTIWFQLPFVSIPLTLHYLTRLVWPPFAKPRAAMIRLYDDLRARHPQAKRISVVIDNARCNRSRELRADLEKPGCRIVPVNLPSYAPNLNLIERSGIS